MKKVIYSLVIVLFLAISNVCYADYGIPMMNPYEAKIVNQEGATTNSYISSSNSTVIPYGTVVKVQYEFDGIAFVEYNGNSVGVNLEDITPTNEVFENLELEEKEKDMYVYREGAYLYNGPSIKYSKVDGEYELPVGTVVHIKSCSDAWGYVEYKGKNGWVYIYTSDQVSPYNMACSLTEIQKEEYAYYYTLKEITLNSIVGAEDSIGTIPAGEHIKSYFYSEYPDPHGKTIYIEHNELKGWYIVNASEVVQDYSSFTNYTAITDKDIELYSDINYEDFDYKFSNVVGKIPAKKEAKIIYETVDNYVNYAYLEYNGIAGWTSDNTSISESKRFWNKEIVKLKQDCKVINFETMEETGEVLLAGETFDVKYRVYPNESTSFIVYCLEKNGKNAWVAMTYNESIEHFETTFQDFVYDDLEKVDLSKIVNIEEKVEETNDLNEENNVVANNSTNNEFRNCILIASVIAVVAIVITIILNKKRKK